MVMLSLGVSDTLVHNLHRFGIEGKFDLRLSQALHHEVGCEYFLFQ